MTPSNTLSDSEIIGLAGKSFNTFCEDISGMFTLDMKCVPQPVGHETVKGLQVRFQDLVVVYSVRAEGALNNTLKFLFDRQGLFVLAGVIAMQPEQIILEDVKSGSPEDAAKAAGVLKEVGAALTGAWERIFSEGLNGHCRFVLTDTFIGNFGDASQEKIGLSADEDFVFAPYEMTVGAYPAFKCGVIFPKAIFDSISEPETDRLEPAEENIEKETEQTVQDQQADIEKVDSDASDTTQQSDIEKSQPQEPAVEIDQKQERPVSEAIKKMAESQPVLPDDELPSTCREPLFEPEPQSRRQGRATTMQNATLIAKDTPLIISAKDIMQKDVIWASPDESVQQALAKIQQHNVGYIMVGREQVLEGIVSKSDLNGAISPYLRTIFAKWRRPLDDATLQIRIKWIMSKPACTIVPDTPLAAIMENMCQAGIKCLPVVDEQGAVRGLVTAFDVFRVLLNQSYIS